MMAVKILNHPGRSYPKISASTGLVKVFLEDISSEEALWREGKSS